MFKRLAIVFDIGNVLLRWDPVALLQGLGFTAEEQRLALAGVVHTPEWLALDRGDIGLDDAVAASTQSTGLASERVRQIYLGVGPALIPMTPMIQFAERLAAQGHGVYVLSNMPEQTWKHLENNHLFFNKFNGLLLSFKENLLKPEPAIYRCLLERFGLDPSRTLFIDDHLPNVEAAGRLEITGVHLADPDQPDRYRDLLLEQVQRLSST